MAKILVAGLNPAWQQIFTLPSLRAGEVNRATGFQALASGKGLNAARVLAAMGHQVSLLQVLAGVRGGRCAEECEVRGIRNLPVWTHGETRTCVTLLHDGSATEIISPFSVGDGAPHAQLSAQISAQLLTRIDPDEAFDALLICGTVPEGLEAGLHGQIAARVRAPLVIWDSVAGLSADVLPRVTWIKVNAAEHRALAPQLAGPEASSSRPALLITDGAAPASVRTRDGAWTCTVPRLDVVVNPIGAGDTATAMLADGLLRGLDARAAAARALAAATASCLNPLPAEWEPADAARLENEVRWEEENEK